MKRKLNACILVLSFVCFSTTKGQTESTSPSSLSDTIDLYPATIVGLHPKAGEVESLKLNYLDQLAHAPGRNFFLSFNLDFRKGLPFSQSLPFFSGASSFGGPSSFSGSSLFVESASCPFFFGLNTARNSFRRFPMRPCFRI